MTAWRWLLAIVAMAAMGACGSSADPVPGPDLARSVRAVATTSARTVQELGSFRFGEGSRDRFSAAAQASREAVERLRALSARASEEQRAHLAPVDQEIRQLESALAGSDRIISLFESLSSGKASADLTPERAAFESDAAMRLVVEVMDSLRNRCAAAARHLE